MDNTGVCRDHTEVAKAHGEFKQGIADLTTLVHNSLGNLATGQKELLNGYYANKGLIEKLTGVVNDVLVHRINHADAAHVARTKILEEQFAVKTELVDSLPGKIDEVRKEVQSIRECLEREKLKKKKGIEGWIFRSWRKVTDNIGILIVSIGIFKIITYLAGYNKLMDILIK